MNTLTHDIKGTYTANCDLPIKYIFQLGGGINGRTLKKGDKVNVICIVNDINAQSVATSETLHRIELASFLANFTPIQ